MPASAALGAAPAAAPARPRHAVRALRSSPPPRSRPRLPCRAASDGGGAAPPATAAAAVLAEAGDDLAALRAAMQRAVDAEDYAAAAALRDRVREVEAAAAADDPVAGLKAALAAAVADERWADAAAARDALAALAPPPLATSSACVTDGVRVEVTSFYVPSQSSPNAGQFLFAYKVAIINEAAGRRVKLVNRHWRIGEGGGAALREVRGPGVVGEQPELEPGERFEYQSACPLSSPRGWMEGEFECLGAGPDGAGWTSSFMVQVARFALDAGDEARDRG